MRIIHIARKQGTGYTREIRHSVKGISERICSRTILQAPEGLQQKYHMVCEYAAEITYYYTRHSVNLWEMSRANCVSFACSRRLSLSLGMRQELERQKLN